MIANVKFYEQLEGNEGNRKPISCFPETKIQLSAEFTSKVDNDTLM